ncbi:hypothetical protein RCN70_20755, partial [Escherichia coli]|nr:hypothetical protein [Escherichia coli]
MMDGVSGAQHAPLASIYVPISFPRRSITLVEPGNPLIFIPPFTESSMLSDISLILKPPDYLCSDINLVLQPFIITEFRMSFSFIFVKISPLKT